jgi:tRNA(Ile)-lysidine synthase
MGPDPAVAAVRVAVRRCLAAAAGAGPVVVACSGGADSLALAAATVHECRGTGRPVVGATVDHALQEGSAERAATVVGQLAGLGVDETLTARVRVQAAGQGVEAAAREARYAVLEEVAARVGSRVVLLGHTLDDQAETVLLGLARGSGGRSIAGMRRSFPPFHRPLLDLRREQTVQACRAEGLSVWDDPHNEDPRFTRARVRHRVLPVLESELGPGVTAALARTADMLQEDLVALDRITDAAYDAAVQTVGEGTGPDVQVQVQVLETLDPAVRRRVLHRVALAAGAPADELFRVHVLAVEELVTAWRGQRMVQLPGHRVARRTGSTIVVGPAAVAG